MNLSFRIAFQFIFSNYKNNFTKTASLLSIIGLSFGVSSLLITFFILNGFENVISEKITNFDGHIQIKHFFNKPFTDSQFIVDSLETKFKDRILIDSFKREPAIIRSKNKNDGVIIVGLDKENNFGAILEIAQLSEGGYAMFEMIKNASKKWDGKNAIMDIGEISI